MNKKGTIVFFIAFKIIFFWTASYGEEKAATPQSNVVQLMMTKSCVNCNLQGANLDRADLEKASLQGSNLTNARFFLANLSGADFTNAILRNVQFGGADVSYADFRGADLSGTSFQGAYMKEALFTVRNESKAEDQAALTDAQTEIITESDIAAMRDYLPEIDKGPSRKEIRYIKSPVLQETVPQND